MNDSSSGSNARSTPEIAPVDAARRAEGVVLVDVREDDEWAAGHAVGAQHIPLDTLEPGLLPGGAIVLCVCRSGRRSATATSMLRAAGVDALNVAGGMNAWASAGLPIVRDDGAPGTVV